MNDTDRQELRYRLATKVMGWSIPKDDNPRLTPHWFLNEAGKRGMRLKDFTPDLPTPQGFYQCFGPGGLVEKMKEKGWEVRMENTSNWLTQFVNVAGTLLLSHDANASTICEATCLAADKAMEGE